MSKIQPLNEHVQVRVLENQNEGKGVYLPETHRKEKYGVGEVLAVEEGFPVKPGDKVLFDTLLLINVKMDVDGKTEELQFIKFSDILGYEEGNELLDNVDE